jgi:hypothetical protein
MQPIMDFRAGFRDINYAHKVQKKESRIDPESLKRARLWKERRRNKSVVLK